MSSVISLDYETFSEAQLTGASSVGLWNYMRDMSTEALMVAYRIDDQAPGFIDLTEDEVTSEIREALLDPEVEKWGFNSAFERLATRNLLGIPTPYKGWRCTQALANLQSFSGDLLTVGRSMGISEDKLKSKEGTRLIQKFSVPQKITRKNSLYRRDKFTDPDDWQLFGEYCVADEVAETEIRRKLLRFPIPSWDWELYELDQEVNDRGLPVNRAFVQHAMEMSERRKAELLAIMREQTGLRNPGSTQQLLPWLRERGYPFDDLQKATVKKVLIETEGDDEALAASARSALLLRQQASRTSIKKYPAILRRLAQDGYLRHCFQFAGAARTARWAGRGPQPQNLTRTPWQLEADDGDTSKLTEVAKTIERGDYDTLGLLMAEPMTALAGSVRTSFQIIEPDEEFAVCDLSAIESAVIAWLTKCKRLLHVFNNGLDPYKDFGTELYNKAYAEITKPERTICKPAVLGCGYQLGAGGIFNGKRTGLWGYAENMGVNITQEEAARQVALFRDTYHEIPDGWHALERAFKQAMNGTPTPYNGLLLFEKLGPYMTIQLPSGRRLYYFKPRMMDKEFVGRDGEKYTRRVISYMGMSQVSRVWKRVGTAGGKLIENSVQAIARDVLGVGLLRAHAMKFPILGHVHDEIITKVNKGSNFLNLAALRDCMMAPIPWAKGLPLGAAGYTSTIYRKD